MSNRKVQAGSVDWRWSCHYSTYDVNRRDLVSRNSMKFHQIPLRGFISAAIRLPDGQRHADRPPKEAQ